MINISYHSEKLAYSKISKFASEGLMDFYIKTLSGENKDEISNVIWLITNLCLDLRGDLTSSLTKPQLFDLIKRQIQTSKTYLDIIHNVSLYFNAISLDRRNLTNPSQVKDIIYISGNLAFHNISDSLFNLAVNTIGNIASIVNSGHEQLAYTINEIAKTGVFQRFAYKTKVMDKESLISALNIIGAIVFKEESVLKVLDHNVFQFILCVLNRFQSLDVKNIIAWIVANLSMSSLVDVHAEMIENSALDLIYELSSDSVVKIRREGVNSLYNLSCYCDMYSHLYKQKALGFVFGLLNKETFDPVRSTLVSILRNMLAADKESLLMSNEEKALIRDVLEKEGDLSNCMDIDYV